MALEDIEFGFMRPQLEAEFASACRSQRPSFRFAPRAFLLLCSCS